MHRASPNSLTNQGEAAGIVMATEKKNTIIFTETLRVCVCVCACEDLVGTVCVCLLAGEPLQPLVMKPRRGRMKRRRGRSR